MKVVRIPVKETARLLGVSRQTAELYMIRTSKRYGTRLRSEVVGGRRYTRQAWIDEWIAATTEAAENFKPVRG